MAKPIEPEDLVAATALHLEDMRKIALRDGPMNELAKVDHEILGIKAKLKWDHITNRSQLEERLADLEAKRRRLLEEGG
jgi:hypothetical protein